MNEVNPVDEGELKGTLVTYLVDGYGETQPYWYPATGAVYAESRRSRSLIPPEYIYKRGKDFDWGVYGEPVDETKKIINAFVARFEDFRRQGRGLYIFSRTKGSGKTMLACCLANEIMDRYDTVVKFIAALDYVELVRGKQEEDRALKKAIKEAGLLIVDDIGTQNDSKQEWIKNVMLDLVDYRNRELLPTIFTSNLSIDQLKEDERTVNRIESASVPLKLPEVSIRKKKAIQRTKEFLQEII